MVSNTEQSVTRSFDLFRVSAGKREVDITPNTLRAYMKRGLPAYRQGKAVFISKIELSNFIKTVK